MTYHTKPAEPFSEFNEDFPFNPNDNIVANLMRYCGFTSLHPQSWLYKWLGGQSNTRKCGGDSLFRVWCDYPTHLTFSEKMPHGSMKLTAPMMERWKEYLRAHKEEIRQNCRVVQWESHYEPKRY